MAEMMITMVLVVEISKIFEMQDVCFLLIAAIYICNRAYSRGHKRSAYKYEFSDFWGVLITKCVSHRVTLNLEVRQGPNRGCTYNRRCVYDREITVMLANALHCRCPHRGKSAHLEWRLFLCAFLC